MGRKRVLTDEQKERRREAVRRWREKHREEINAKAREHQRIYRAENKDKVRESGKKYYAAHRDEKIAYQSAYNAAHREERVAYRAAHYQNNREEKIAYQAAWRAANPDYDAAYGAAYRATKHGRAKNLRASYNHRDDKRGFDISNNVTPEWIVANIFSGQKCIYCGDSDWTHLGCDRIDNDKPHTPDNCIPCCGICNIEKWNKFSVEGFKKYRELHPRTLGNTIEKNWEISELPNGTKVIKKKSAAAS